MQYSPKLKKAAKELKEILLKHDIAGVIVIHTPGFAEFLTHVEPSYSCAKQEGEKLRLKATLESCNGDKAKRSQLQKDTANMFSLLAQVTKANYEQLHMISRYVDDIVKAEHDEGNTTSHTAQNN